MTPLERKSLWDSHHQRRKEPRGAGGPSRLRQVLCGCGRESMCLMVEAGAVVWKVAERTGGGPGITRAECGNAHLQAQHLETGGRRISCSRPSLLQKVEINLGYMRHCLKQNKTKTPQNKKQNKTTIKSICFHGQNPRAAVQGSGPRCPKQSQREKPVGLAVSLGDYLYFLYR